jgi:murein DD-endopeptidase MepM/ murein hydrolase activator NlpD
MSLKEKLSLRQASETFNRCQTTIQNKWTGIRKKTKIITGSSLLSIIVLAAVWMVYSGSVVYTLSVDQTPVGYIDDPKKINETIELVKADMLAQFGVSEVVCDGRRVTFEKADQRKNDVTLLNTKQLKMTLSKPDLYSANAWVIKVADKNLVAATTEAEAKAILEKVKTAYKTEGTELIKATFKENVAVAQEMTSFDLIKEPDDAVAFITTGTTEPKVYTVKDGDTMWDIAHSSKMSTADLETANPGFDPDRLKIGQQLNLYEKKPFVTVLTTEKVVEENKVDFKTVYENTDTLYRGEVKVKTPGVYGIEETFSEVVKENGSWVSTKVINTVSITEPKVQVALKGTKSLSTFVGSGILSSPLSGYISSVYGSRGGGRHTGIDIPGPKGSPIRAADAGVVTFAASSGAYGNLIKISHGNGIQTWYGHCNTFNVSVGDIVEKGQTIGTVGITGRATGYHLHFEVRKSGTPVDPLNYI